MYISATFYKYFNFENCNSKRDEIKELMLSHECKGKIIISPEGVNGAICTDEVKFDSFMDYLSKIIPALRGIESRKTLSEISCFKRTLVKVRDELVPLGVEGVSPNTSGGGEFISPNELKKLYETKEDFVIVDARNDYEWEEGSFLGAENPNIEKFRDFKKVAKKLDETLPKDKKVITFCTGGIRCEKASAYLKSQGFNDVYKLKGGIIEFLKLKDSEKYWKGDLFVFDKRNKINSPDVCEH